jgi:hypothetical protein
MVSGKRVIMRDGEGKGSDHDFADAVPPARRFDTDLA